MVATVIRAFGGVMPSVQPRNLGNEAAQIAQNLDMRFGDFRPARGLGASVTAVAAGVKSIFRAPSGTWLSSTNDVDYVLGQIEDADVERVYLTGRSAYPEAWEAGVYRRLGVPRPTTAVTVTVDTVDEFSTSELTAARKSLPERLFKMYLDSLETVKVGPAMGSPPTTTTDGWLEHGSQPDLPTKSDMQYAFCVPMVTNDSGSYVMKYPELHTFLLLPELGGKRITYGGNQYWAVPLYTQGLAQQINEAELTAALQTVMRPDDAALRMWTDPEIANIIATQVAQHATTTEPVKSMVDGISASLNQISTVYTGSISGMKAAMEAFFERPEVEEELLELIGDPAYDSPARKDGIYTQEVAGRCYAMGHFDVQMQSADLADTRYFSADYDTSKAANIRADYESCIYTDDRGVKSLNRSKLRDILREEMTQLITSRSSNRWPMEKVDAEIAYVMGLLDKVFADSHWSQNPAWPYKSGPDRQYGSAAVSARDAMQSACEAIGSHYELVKQRLEDYLYNNLFDADILPRLPKVVDRIQESRCYIYTYVTDWGEESAPSPASVLIDCDQNDTVTVVAPAPPAGKFIRRIRLYRSSSSNMGSAFQFVIENDVDVSDIEWNASADYRTLVDNFRQEQLQETCPSMTWDPPPDDGVGLVGMPNGMMLMFAGQRVYPCEPGHPYAYPIEYQQTMEFDFVGAAVFGNTAVILTTGNPYYASGADSASLSLDKRESNQSCISKRSICVGAHEDGTMGGVFYASPDGVCLATSSGVVVLTEGAYSRKDWLALNPANSIGRFSEGIYYLFLLSSNTVLAIDLKSRRISTMSLAITAAYSDLATDTLYVAEGTQLRPMFGGDALTGLWRSKVMVSNSGWSFTCHRVESDFDAPVTVRYYGDGVLIHTATFTGRQAKRLPAGKWRDLEVEIESTGAATVLAMATSMYELSKT